ncbi:hypothetical protein BDA96_03G230700 [Sorghum bicolor]|uniref:AAA+ ATPase domain-containing protein n=1 Tax=Sorghum bicolor TaxID=4558 RepID=A0A921UN54_SORBI|nr:hypothetical protein BDA96_03G230700 [Sorghum bicolor]
MENTSSNNSLFMSAIGIGIGLGVGLGLVSTHLMASSLGGDGTLGGGATAADIELELRRLLVDGQETNITFAKFPYYLSEEMRLALMCASFPYLSQTILPKHIKVFKDSSHTILLCGQSETCLRSLAKAIANQFNARLLELDIFEFLHQIQHKYGGSSNAQVPIRSKTLLALEKVYDFVGSLSIFCKNDESKGSVDHEKDNLDLKTRFWCSILELGCENSPVVPLQDDYVEIASYLEDILAPAVAYHLMNNQDPKYRNGRLILSSTSLCYGLRIFQESNLEKDSVETKDDSKVTKYNEYEKRIRELVIPASETGVTFDDIGALADIKESIRELVMLPLQRPDLFNGGLLKPCRGILLFGPPGTGKTMLAKAIANEVGASFMNISMSTIMSKWFGEAEKSIQALFSLATKIAPSIIFMDEVDSMLGTRERSNENEVSRRIKSEFMTHWDGILSKPSEKILVLGATNRPFDLDDAIIRRYEHRIMVGLPTLESRELIFHKLLSKENIENIDFKELGKMTEGYSGSDLKSLCVAAAYRPVRELLQKEKQMKKDKKEKEVQGKNVHVENSQKEKSKMEKSKINKDMKAISEEDDEAEIDEVITLRPLIMEDLKQAKDEVSASFAIDGAVMNEIKQWNELYGRGGSRNRQKLTYFM